MRAPPLAGRMSDACPPLVGRLFELRASNFELRTPNFELRTSNDLSSSQRSANTRDHRSRLNGCYAKIHSRSRPGHHKLAGYCFRQAGTDSVHCAKGIYAALSPTRLG